MKLSNDAASSGSSRTKSAQVVSTICPIRRPKDHQTRLVGAFDGDTGEVIGWMLESIDRPPLESDWLKLYKVVAVAIANDERYNTETRVLFWLLANIQFGNFVPASVAHIAKELKINRRTVSRVVAPLMERGLLQRDKVKGVTGMRWNPNSAFCGTRQLQALKVSEWNSKLSESRDARASAEQETLKRFQDSTA